MVRHAPLGVVVGEVEGFGGPRAAGFRHESERRGEGERRRKIKRRRKEKDSEKGGGKEQVRLTTGCGESGAGGRFSARSEPRAGKPTPRRSSATSARKARSSVRISVFSCSLLSADSPRESDATRPESGPKRPTPITVTGRSDDVENAGDVGWEGEKEAYEWRGAERFRGRGGRRFRGGDWPGRVRGWATLTPRDGRGYRRGVGGRARRRRRLSAAWG